MSKVANYGLIILTWLYLENPNSNHIIEIQQLVVKWAPYWEVGNYLWHSFYLKNEKSTHKRISPFFLQTRSKFATHSEYLTRKMILAVKSLSNSLCMVASRVGLTSLCLWQVVESPALIGMACWIIPNQILLTLSKSKKNIMKLMKMSKKLFFLLGGTWGWNVQQFWVIFNSYINCYSFINFVPWLLFKIFMFWRFTWGERVFYRIQTYGVFFCSKLIFF